MHSARPRKKYGTDINRYLGIDVETPGQRIRVPLQQYTTGSRRESRSSRFSFHRVNSSALSFRDAMKAKLSSTTAVDAPTQPQYHHGSRSGLTRKWRNKSTSSAQMIETPVKDGRTNTLRTTSTRSANEVNDTTFLPELYSTPPMPAFQKPVPSSNLQGSTPGSTTVLKSSPPIPRRNSSALPPLTEPVQIKGLSRSAPRSMPSSPLIDGAEGVPPLPGGWSEQHDRAICVLDARNYFLPNIVVRMRRAFPGLRGALTVPMVDKRLRQLDQNVELDYWRVGLLGKKHSFIEPVMASPGGKKVSSGTGSETRRDKENEMPLKVFEPTLKATLSGSLVKAQSVSNLIPDTVHASSGGHRLRST